MNNDPPPFTLWELLALIASLIFLAFILYALDHSPTGFFPTYPHTGATPDCPTPAPINPQP